MQAKHFIHWSIVVLCLVHSSKSENTLIDTFNDIYATCLVNLQTDCIQPKALEWFKRVIEKREIQITDDLSILKNETATIADEEPTSPEQEDGARNNNVNLLSQVDTFLATHYLNIRYPKSALVENVPSFLASTVNRMVPEGLQVPLEEGNPNEGRGLVKKVLVPFLLGLKFKTTVLLPLAFALIALKAWKALTLGLISLVVSTAVVVFKLAKPKVINYEVVHYPHPHHHHYDHHLAHHLEHVEHHPHLEVHPDLHHAHLHDVGHLDVHPHIDHLAPHDIAYPAHAHL